MSEFLANRFAVICYGDKGHCVGCEAYPNTIVIESSLKKGTITVKGPYRSSLTLSGREIHEPTMPPVGHRY